MKRESSPPFFVGSPEPDQIFSVAASYPDAVESTHLPPSQEKATLLHVKIYKDRETYFELRLSSARPQTDAKGAVTNESLFAKITSMANKPKPSTGEIYALEATFCPDDLNDKTPGSDDIVGDWPDRKPFMILRGEEDTFKCFQSRVLDFHNSICKVSWHVDLRVIAE